MLVQHINAQLGLRSILPEGNQINFLLNIYSTADLGNVASCQVKP